MTAESTPEDREPEPQPGVRITRQAEWVDFQIRQAMARGEFDDLPGAGKPIPGIDGPHDPDWWLKGLIEREKITGVLPPALALRTENLRLDDELDALTTEKAVRAVIEDFNARVKNARRQLEGGPPVITPLRDPEAEVTAWRERRTERLARNRALLEQEARDRPGSWWSRWRRKGSASE